MQIADHAGLVVDATGEAEEDERGNGQDEWRTLDLPEPGLDGSF